MSSELVLNYIPVKNEDEAKKLAHKLLERKIIACANLIPKITSLYTWKQKIEQETECLLLTKTTTNNIAALEEFIQSHHSYETPCVFSINAISVNQTYAQWLKESVN